MGGLVSLLKSRKFWLAAIAVAVSFGFLTTEQAAAVTAAILVLLGGGIALEDAATKIGGTKNAGDKP